MRDRCYLMSKQAMNYILEKMRGDSLTPLGIGTPSESFFKDKDTLRRYKPSDSICPEINRVFPKILREYLKTKTLFKGKWVPEDKYLTKFSYKPVKGITYMIGPSNLSAMGSDFVTIRFVLRVDGVLYQDMILDSGSKGEMVRFLKGSFGIVWDGDVL